MRKIIPPSAVLIPPSAKKVFTGQIFDVYQWPQKLYDGTTTTFEMLRRPDACITIAVKDDKIVVEKEEQPHCAKISFPGGRNDVDGEDEFMAAAREMLEETGLAFAKWKLLDAYQPEGKIDWLVYIFLATDFISETTPELDAGEKISWSLMDFSEVKKLVETERRFQKSGEILRRVNSLEELLNLPEYSTK